MKKTTYFKILVLSILFIQFFSVNGQVQETAVSFELKDELEGAETYEYTARESIILKKGFSYKAEDCIPQKIIVGWEYDVEQLEDETTPTITIDETEYEGDEITSSSSFPDIKSSGTALASALLDLGDEWEISFTAGEDEENPSFTIEISYAGKFVYYGNYDTEELESSYETAVNFSFLASIDEKLILDADYLAEAEEPSTIPDTDLELGSIAGSFNVSSSGAATYTVPIAISPGTMGMQPSISIVYNSQSGNGPLGIGWNISGLSAITRVGANLYSDEEAGGVNLDMNDKFALDGNRLLLSNETSYGAAGSSYTVQNQTFAYSTIKASGTAGNGPQYFVVTTKDGKTLYYGNSPDSRALADGSSTPYMWRLNKIEDANGNYMTYTYKTENGESVIDEINYTGNDDAGLDTYNSLQFYYDTKSDANTYYIGGASVDQALLLREIRSYNEDDLFRKYNLYYTESNFSHLNKITQTASDGSELNPTIISWGSDGEFADETITVNNADYNSTDVEDKYWLSGDLNGDGLTDLIAMYNYESTNYFQKYEAAFDDDRNLYFNRSSNPYSLPENVNGEIIKTQFDASHLFNNFDGDNEAELIVPYLHKADGYYCEIVICIINENYNSVAHDINLDNSETPAFATGDFNNDGINDLIYIEHTPTDEKYNGAILYPKPLDKASFSEEINFSIDEPQTIFANDFNGDGLTDIFILTENGYYIYKNTGGDFDFHFVEIAVGDEFNSTYVIKQGDFDGDGLIDFILNEKDTRNWFLATNDANWGFSLTSLPNITARNEIFTTNDDCRDNCIVVDLNQDGKSDVIIIDAVYDKESNWIGETWGEFNTYNITSYISTGDSFIENSSITSTDENYSYTKTTVTGDFNGDGRLDIINYGSDLFSSITTDEQFRIYSTFNDGFDDEKVISITDGYSNTTEIEYRPLSYEETEDGETFYSPESSAEYPLMDIQAPIYCVQNVTTPDGIGGTTATSYSYAGAKIHTKGLGFRGFGTVTTSNSITGISSSTETTLDETYYLPSEVVTTVETTSGNAISTTKSTFTPTASNGSVFNPVTETESSDELNSNTVTTTYEYETTSTGDLEQDKTGYTDGSYVQHEYSNYVLGKPGLVTLTKKHKDYSSVFQEKTYFAYDESTGNLLEQIENYEVTGKQVTTAYSGYNDVGQPTTVTQSATDVETYTTYLTYDDTKRFVIEKENDFGTITASYNKMTGQKVSEKDDNGLETTYTYDTWGRQIKTVLPTGIEQSSTYNWYTGSAINNALFYTYTTANNSPWVKTYYDALSREVYSETIGFSNVDIHKKNDYNEKGQVSSTTSVKGGVTASVDYEYDDYGRISNKDYSTGKTVMYEYPELSTKITENGNLYIKTYDCMGNITSVTEPIANHTISYAYHSNGSPTSITAPGSIITMGYDEVGNQDTLVDPDAGTSTYSYDAFGRMTYQKDANGNEFTLAYDNLGRLNSKVDQDGETTTYTYVESGNGKNQLLKETRGDLWKQYGYDSYGRVTTTIEHVSDAISDQVYTYTYNTNSDVKTIVYPSGLTVVNTFDDDYGFLTGISADNNTIWTLTSDNGTLYSYKNGNDTKTYYKYNSYGLPTQIYTEDSESDIIQGYSYSFNATTGNLTTRTDSRSGYESLTETFSYDDINRLTSGEINSSTTYSYSYTSDGAGNFNSKSDAGTYVYADSDKPHQLTKITDVTETLESQVVEYTTFNKVDNIAQGGDDIYDFTYGPDNQRRIMVNHIDGSTTYYFGTNEVEVKDGITREISYISSGNGMIAIDVKRSDDNDTLYYVHKDHLGSILAISNNKNDDVQLQNFDAWGRYRNPNTWTYSNSSRITATNRGFTGHEHLLDCNLINMNGRVYDPFVGMFLSPDNYVQSPSSTQNFNRYAYCLNNPLIYTDPSGEIVWAPIIIGAVIGTYMGGTMANNGDYTPWDNGAGDGSWDFSSGKTWGYMLGGAVVGGLSGYVGGAVAAADIPMANTLGIAGASLTNSVGTFMYTGGQTDISVSFGLGTYNFSNNTWDGIWNWNENSTLENIGYTFGALANIQDLAALNMGGPVDYNSLKHPTGHGSLTNPNGTIDISKGFESGNILWGGKGMKWGTAPANELFPRIRINNVNENFLEWMTGNISLATDKGLLGISEASYGLIGNTCASQVSRALTYAGVLGLNPFTIHPSSLYLQLLARQAGIYSSSYLYQMPNN